MKKIWLLTFVMTLLFTSNVLAESYTVKRGDILSRIAKHHGLAVKEIMIVNPIIKNVNQIKIGWKLEIPVSGSKNSAQVKVKKPGRIEVVGKEVGPLWSNPGGNKYRGTIEEGLKILGYGPNEQMGLIQEVASGNFSFANIQHTSRGGMVVAEDGAKFRMVKMLSGTGQIITGPEGVTANWKDKSKMEAGKIYSFGDNYFMLPLRCGNPTMLIKVSGLPIAERIIEGPTISTVGSPVDGIIPSLERTAPEKWSGSGPDNWDWYIGGGNYRNRIDGDDNNGHYAWTKLRYRPFWYTPDANSLGIQKVGLGFVGFLSGGEGIAAKYYEYEWSQAAAGLTAKVYAKKSDYDFDAMIFRLQNEGTWMGTGGNKQIDYGLLLSAHGNFYRDGKPDWFPKFELNAEARLPFNTELKRGEETNNRVIEANYTQWIYKIEFGEGDSFAVSPGFNLGAGYEWSSQDEFFVKFGPAFEFSSHGNVVGALSVLNYKIQGDGQWHPISGYISLDGIWRAYQASQITSVSDEELRGGSKLLRNPADFL